MTKTRTQLVHRTLKNLGALPQGQTPSDEEYDSVDDLIEPVIAELKAEDTYTVRDPNDVDDAVFLSLGHILADAARVEYGELGTTPGTELNAKAEMARMKLKKIGARRPTYATLRTDYF